MITEHNLVRTAHITVNGIFRDRSVPLEQIAKNLETFLRAVEEEVESCLECLRSDGGNIDGR